VTSATPSTASTTIRVRTSLSEVRFDYVQLTATSLTALTVASLEFLQDAPNADAIVSDAIAATMALEIDKAAMFGQLGATGTNDEGSAFGLASPYPKGILKNLLDNASGQVLGFATNGTAQTAATPWNELLALYYQMVTQNEKCPVFISNAKGQQQYQQMYDTTYQPLRMPSVLQNVNWLVTNAIPSFTRGTMTNRATDFFAGDFSQVLIGERMSLEVRTLTERYAENGQVGILSYWRGDVQVARPKALGVYRAIQGAA
jgi:HK97 family phage major capsid protein